MSDDEEQFNPKAHKGLLQAISSLGKTQHIRKTTRSEPQRLQDEFQLIKPADHAARRYPVGLQDIVQVLKTTKKHVDAGKQLKVVQSTKKVLDKPLEKPQAERIKRDLGYETAKKKLNRWNAVVSRNRIAETQIFPLRAQETIYVNTSRFRNPRKQAPGNADLDGDEAAANEEALLKRKLTRDELVARRKELAYIKIRESQKSAKARLQNKIKSKKYHKLMKRQKLQEQIKQFEMLQKVDPEAALEKLNELEKSRVMERASLRHKNTGSWAKNLQIRAKYDKEVRKDLAEQLQISRQLTQKKDENEEESDDENAKKAKLTAAVEAESKGADPFNPWTRTAVSAKNDGKEVDGEGENWRKYWLERNDNEKMLEKYKELLAEESGDALAEKIDHEDDDEHSENMATINKVHKTSEDSIGKVGKKKKVKKVLQTKSDKKKNMEEVEEVKLSKFTAARKCESIDDIFDKQEDKIKQKLSKKLQKLAQQAKKSQKPLDAKQRKILNKEKAQQESEALKSLNDLSFKNEKIRPEIDEELVNDMTNDNTKSPNSIEALTKVVTAKAKVQDSSKSTEGTSSSATTTSATIDPTKLAEVKLKQRMSDLTGINQTIADDDALDIDDEEDELEHERHAQQMTISQAFEDDDIVADFTQDKVEGTELKNTEVDLTLPGWGSWAGAGISAERQRANKNKRLVLKLAKKEKRRDENKGGVYINEEVNKKLRSHLVSDLPFPFTSVADYEASLRAPIGRTFVPETAMRLLTRPAVITRKGQIIEPMDHSELLQPEPRPHNPVDMRIKMAQKQKIDAEAPPRKRVATK